MTKICWLSRLSNRQSSPVRGGRIAGGIGVAILLVTTGIAVAQTPAPETQPVTAPKGYTVHQAVDLGGRIANVNGSGSMYDTLVNEQSGPRVLGETFTMRALPDAKNTLFDSLTAVGSGFGGDPYSFAKMDFYKGKMYEFSGLFRRDRQYFDYDLLGNPNIPSGQSTPIGPTAAPTGSLPWSQVNQSPFLYNTVRRMTDVNLTVLPLDKVSFRVAYSHNTFEGPSLSPSGYQLASAYDILLQEYQRNGTDDFTAGVDFKPIKDTRLTLEEQIDHYKADSFFTADQAYFNVQEPDGTKVALLANYDSLTPYAASACNANSVGTTPILSAPPISGGLPIVNPACAVLTSYLRSQPTRFFYPTEIFRLQSSSIRNISMNGDVRYTEAKMSLPSYYENFQGLARTTRSLTYTATATAQRKVTAADYGIEWQAARQLSVSDQVTFSNVQQPGTTTMSSLITVATPATANNETINSTTLTATTAATGAGTFEGSGSVGVPNPDFFGQKWISNDLTATWDGWSHGTISLTWRHSYHLISEGLPHSVPIVSCIAENPPGVTCGTAKIDEDGGILNIAVRPASNWDINGSAEISYFDNSFTPMGARQLQHYRVHTLYKVKPWAIISGAYNDRERHNNTSEVSPTPIDGPLQHVDHSRVGSIGAQINPNPHYGMDINYSYSDVYASTNICYNAFNAPPSATFPGASSPTGTACPGATVRGASYLEFGPVKDFMDAPTNSGSAAFRLTTTDNVNWGVGYRISSVDGTRFYNDARDVAGSLVSKYQSPYVNVAWTVRPGWIWKMEYDYYGYGEGGPSGAQYCATTGPTATTPATVEPCASSGAQVGLTLPNSGETAARTFRANNLLLGFHYEF